MPAMDDSSTTAVNIRQRVRDHHMRQLKVAALSAPADWQSALRAALQAERGPTPPIITARDVKLFVQSFLMFFTTLMVFLF
jgi:hypothetical protein